MDRPAIIYLRISSDRTGQETGVARQREDCLRLAELRGWRVGGVESDNDVSAAGRARRPGFERVIQAIGSGEIGVIVSWSLDRLTRNRQDTLRLIEACQEHGVTLALVRGADLDMSTPGGRLMADLFASIARNEIEVKSDRQKRANRQRAEAGEPHVARRAFGYQPGGMNVHAVEAAVLRDVVEKFLSGWSYRELVKHLNAAGYQTAGGNQFRIKTLQDHLASKRNAGIRVYEDQEFDAVWEAIIDRETHARVLTEMARRKGVRAGAPVSRKYLLTGFLYCGRCNQTMVGHKKKDSRTSVARRRYECPDYPEGDRCANNSRLAEPLEYLVREAILYRLDTPDLAQLLAVADSSGEDERELLKRQDSLRARIGQLVDDYADGTLNKADFARARQRVGDELELVESELGTSFASGATADLFPAGETVRKAWDHQSDGWRGRVIGTLVERIVVHPSRKLPDFYIGDQRYRFDADSIEIEWLV